MPTFEGLLAESARFHGGLCPGQVLGVRMAMLGLNRLGLGVPITGKRLVACMVDRWGRQVTYLRVAITARCNLRCQYCVPSGPSPAAGLGRELSPVELRLVGEVAGALGIRRIRLTGGEPLVRPDLPTVVEALSSAPGVEEVALTTNGLLLASSAPALAAAGLRRVNVSLDTLRPERFRAITGFDGLERVLAGLAAVEAMGLWPIKINVVAMRGVNDDELADLAHLTLARPWHVRFIELMPVGAGPDDRRFFDERYLSIGEVRARLGLLEPLPPEPGGPARLYRLPGARGKVGFIAPVSEHFCSTCNRLRLTAWGELRSCLFYAAGVDLRPALEHRDRAGVAALFREATRRKPGGSHLGSRDAGEAATMARIGG